MGDTRADPFLGPDAARFPNTRRRASASSPDDPASPSQPLAPEAGPSSTDPDTCRICRGEATREEALFHPCKCSGSIKYVHQDCLMEWLSHSQKKHCELCKTPFRFTKLYSPDMPKALPFSIFLSHMVKYLLKNLLVWLRAALVASVWLGWLPYLMRSVWSFLFWISDEGLGSGSSLLGRHNGTGGTPGFDALAAAATNGTTVCSSSPLFDATTTVLTTARVADKLPSGSVQLGMGLPGINFTSTEPLYSTFVRLLFGTVGLAEKPTASNASEPSLERLVSGSATHPTLLSEVGFLRNLTRHASINRTIIAILEGQIITILVIVCFILIILVRDYVVQQQPEINMRAAFAAAENVVPQPPRDDPGVPAEAIEHLAGPGEEHVDDESDAEETVPDREPYGQPDIELDGHATDSQLELSHADVPSANDSFEAEASTSASADLSHLFNAPGIFSDPERPRPDMIEGSSTVQEYLRVYREAGGDAEKILRIAREQELEDKLDYWIELTRSVMNRQKQAGEGSSETGDQAGSVADISAVTQHGASEDDRTAESWGPAQSSEWTWPDERQPRDSPNAKGKGKLPANVDEDPGPSLLLGNPLVGSPLRPRANTDGPKLNGTVNPLANNNWSFADLPPEPSTASTPSPLEDPLVPGPVASASRPAPDNSRLRYPTPPSSMLAEVGSPETGSTSSPSIASTNDEQHMSETYALPPPLQDAPGPSRQAIPGQEAQGVETAAQPYGPDAAPPRRQPAVGLVDRVANFMWRDVDAIDPAELVVRGALGEFGDNEDGDLAGIAQDEALVEEVERDREVVEAAVAAGLDPEAIEDAEDLEGILELLGMRGPIAGLLQNAIFCAFLVSITIFLGIFVPYNIGRITVWTVANPVRPARMLFSLSKFVQDCALIVVGLCSCLVSHAMHTMSRVLNVASVANYMLAMTTSSWDMAAHAANRIGESFMTELPIISASEMRNFSAVSHDALLVIKGHSGQVISAVGELVMFVFGGAYPARSVEAVTLAVKAAMVAWEGLKVLPEVIANPGSWVINLSLPETAGAINPDLAYWDGMDRFWAIIGGYVALCIMAGLYLRRGTPFSSSQTGQEWEASIIDGLNQASGVMKVILIIGIEMLIFPLYCGMLLDIALLPLFEDTSIKSRLLFTVNYPLTSIFVHWFVGTGYMFHFALFVSMCRKIMRKGVLYFIRDPDDPEFHPVRDVLERNVTTQLRKILFSAFVYGALVVVCLGGVVWGLSFSLPGVLPIHYSSNEPVLEFPIDLLFYNFLMPLAVRFFKPSDGLHAMYTWWFRKCARALRITWFLFGERRVDEEGHLALAGDSPHRNLPWWRSLFLELDADGQVIPRTWSDAFEGGTAKPTATIPTDEMILLNVRKSNLVNTAQLLPDGRFVRAPASDQVKIPKGRRVFLDVTEQNIRQDGKLDRPETDLYSTNQYQFVYVPPYFRVRVFLFILFIWVFAAVTGVGITIVPLVFGRHIFNLLIPRHIRTNDIYAFSIGIYLLGSAAYLLFHLRSIYRSTVKWITASAVSFCRREGVRRAAAVGLGIARIAYAYSFLLLVFPLMVSSLMELYALIPLHEFRYSVLLASDLRDSMSVGKDVALNPRHSIRIIQAWTIGLLYLKLGARFITSFFEGTRLAAAVRAVLRRGWLDPDLAVLTRAFVVPGVALWLAAVATPLLFAQFTIRNGLAEVIMQKFGAVVVDELPDQHVRDAYLVLIYRLSFPLMALVLTTGITMWSMVGVFRSWKVRIRDEAYLIGERLHNFGVVNGPPRARGSWRTGGPRL
ncbi:putative E3 ubiquitin ligase SUD1 [Diplogelasinospora grovesii]|uniref:RING-type E3 ubiquitin transferase n=1 Tax=Diplogelasinospora grovesii TaxID=303347 RepID=A0AAN6S4I0_9PEZI|nr:putative E3 ubiquitin ligase SUD1 [Diplogelasinospora grovesii]